MSTIKINDIIEYLTKNGLTPEDVENDDESACLNYDSFWIDISCTDGNVTAVFTAPLDFRTTFDKRCVTFINEFATHWEICNGFIKVTFKVKDKQELLTTVRRYVTMFIEREGKYL